MKLQAFIFDSQYILASTSGVKQLLSERLYHRDLQPGVVEAPFFTTAITTGDERAVSVRSWYDKDYRCVSWWKMGFTVDPRRGRDWINFSAVIGLEDYKTLWCCPKAIESWYRRVESDDEIIELVKTQAARHGDNASAMASAEHPSLDKILPPLNEDALYELGQYNFVDAAKEYKDILIKAVAHIVASPVMLASKKPYIVPEELADERKRLAFLLSATVPTWQGRDLALITLEPRPGLWKHYQVVIGVGSVPPDPDDEWVTITKGMGRSPAKELDHKTAVAIVDKLIVGGMGELRRFYQTCEDEATTPNVEPSLILFRRLAKERNDSVAVAALWTLIDLKQGKVECNRLSETDFEAVLQLLQKLRGAQKNYEQLKGELVASYRENLLEKEEPDAVLTIALKASDSLFQTIAERVEDQPERFAACQPKTLQKFMSHRFHHPPAEGLIWRYLDGRATAKDGSPSWHFLISQMPDEDSKRETAHDAVEHFKSELPDLYRKDHPWNSTRVGTVTKFLDYTIELLCTLHSGLLKLDGDGVKQIIEAHRKTVSALFLRSR